MLSIKIFFFGIMLAAFLAIEFGKIVMFVEIIQYLNLQIDSTRFWIKLQHQHVFPEVLGGLQLSQAL